MAREGRKMVCGWYPIEFIENVEQAALARGLSIHAFGVHAINRALSAAGQSAQSVVPPSKLKGTSAGSNAINVRSTRAGKKMLVTSVEDEISWACKALALANRQSMEAWLRTVIEAEMKEGK